MLRPLALALLLAGASLWSLAPAAAQVELKPGGGPGMPVQPPAAPEPPLDQSLNEEVAHLPITVKTVDGRAHRREFVLTVFKPNGAGPFPTVIASHGREPSKRGEFGRSRVLRGYFVRRGFAVLAPTRVGYGVSGYDIDPERSYGVEENCDGWRYEPLAANVAAHIREAIAYARRQPWADGERLLLAGVSAGGFGSVVAAADLPARILAVVNFAGGIGGKNERLGRPCNPKDVEQRMATAAKRKPLPTIWIYAENDRLWGPRVPRDWHAAYVAAGGRAELHVLPPIGQDGHDIIDPGFSLWRPHLDRFLATVGLDPRKPPPGTPPPSGFASLEDVGALPLVSNRGREGYKAFLRGDVPRAFAIGPDGSWAWVEANPTAVETALARCRGFAKTPCSLYAVNDNVVWKP
jgi:dienelactone hydrolase